MKELSIEEKAKAYDEAIEKAKNCLKDGTITNTAISYIGTIFPELKEPEDERMIQYFKDLAPFDNADELYEKYGFSHKDAIAWLEKQGEHANFLSKIQVGDKVTLNEDGVLVNLTQLNRVVNKGIENAIKTKQGEQKQTVIIPRFRVGDVITSTKNSALKYKIKAVGVLNELGEYDYVVEDVTDTDYKGRIHKMSISKVDEWGVVIKDKIYEVENPYWLSDTFVFCKRHYNDVFLVGELDLVCYIKVNANNQIEGIGCDFERRFGQDLNAILKRNDVKRSTNLHAIMFTLIGDEYWLKLFRERKEK
jgi:hypothetical protein